MCYRALCQMCRATDCEIYSAGPAAQPLNRTPSPRVGPGNSPSDITRVRVCLIFAGHLGVIDKSKAPLIEVLLESLWLV